MASQEASVPYGPDRQRMLNVLAQRRYRQRKRERLQSLEKRLNARTGGTNALDASSGEIQLQHPIQVPLPGLGNLGTAYDPTYDLFPDLMVGASSTSYMCLAPYELASNSSDSSSSNVGNHFGNSSLLPYGGASQTAMSTPNSQISAELQDLETSQFTFPSEHSIEIPALKNTEVTLRIAHMLGIADNLMDLGISRVLDVSKIPVSLEDIPYNLRPTEAQILLPHFPVIDVIPWPSVRTKLICLFNQPDHLRPPIARGPMAVMRLLDGFDDEYEGIRVTLDMNGHGFDGKCWEAGQAVLKDWWWALDSEIISNSNRLRNTRGAPKLQFGSP